MERIVSFRKRSTETGLNESTEIRSLETAVEPCGTPRQALGFLAFVTMAQLTFSSAQFAFDKLPVHCLVWKTSSITQQQKKLNFYSLIITCRQALILSQGKAAGKQWPPNSHLWPPKRPTATPFAVWLLYTCRACFLVTHCRNGNAKWWKLMLLLKDFSIKCAV